jgi:hypothetical protein
MQRFEILDQIIAVHDMKVWGEVEVKLYYSLTLATYGKNSDNSLKIY